MRLLLPLTSLLLLPQVAAAADPLAIQTIGDEKYAEQIVAIADLDDGGYAKVHFGISNVGPGDGKAACNFLLVDAKGRAKSGEKVVDRDGWRYDAKAKSLTIGDCTATNDGGLVMRAKVPAGFVEIALDAAAKRERAHDAKIGDDFYELDTLVKWANATVTIDVDGDKRTAKGRGYADHPRSKILPGTLAKQWFRFRALRGDDPRLVLIRFPASGPVAGWHEAKEGRRDPLVRALLQPGPKNEWRARLKGANGEWRVTTTKLLHRSAPVEERGAVLGSMISAIVGNPVTYTFRGELVERGSKARVPGIIEITLTDE